MNLQILYKRIANLITKPAVEFRSIAEENASIVDTNKAYIIPLSLLVAICTLIGSAIINIKSPIDSFIFVLINAVIVFVMMFSQTYLAGKAIQLLGKNINDEHNENYYILTAYAQIALFISMSLIKLFPSLIFLIFISLYSGIIFYTGIPTLTKIPEDKRMSFTILSLIIMAVTLIVSSELFTLLYSEIIELF